MRNDVRTVASFISFVLLLLGGIIE